jgi:hypothetical protein
VSRYALRRYHYGLPNKETAFQSFAVVFSVQFVSSFFVNLVISALYILKRMQGEICGLLISFEDVKIWADVFMPALAPGTALFAWILCERWKVGWLLSIVIICVVVGVSFKLSQYAYEYIAGEWRGYYWHQLGLGFFLPCPIVVQRSSHARFY